MRENKGITLIALIVTIIVLLILAAVSIAPLMGKNGVITNAQKTSTQNAYYGAIEQAKLAYMAVRTEIMSKVVVNGQYSPVDDIDNLVKIVKNDLSGSEWAVTKSGSDIVMKYSDKAIDQGVITDDGTNKVPLKESEVNFTITLGTKDDNTSKDAAVLKIDV